MKKITKINLPVDHCWNTRGVWSDVPNKCELLLEHIHCRNCPVFSIEGKRVFHKPAPVGYLKEWRKTLATEQKKQKNNSNAVLVFRVSSEWFALPAACLKEITEKKVIHRIPRNINSDISGVVNVGGEVRVCYSLQSIFGVSQDAKNDDVNEGRFVVALLDDRYYVFLVDQVSGLSWYDNEELFPAPATLEYEAGNMISGVISHDSNNVAVLNMDIFQRSLEGVRL